MAQCNNTQLQHSSQLREDYWYVSCDNIPYNKKNRTFATKQDQNRTTFLKKVWNRTFAGKPDQSGGTAGAFIPKKLNLVYTMLLGSIKMP